MRPGVAASLVVALPGARALVLRHEFLPPRPVSRPAWAQVSPFPSALLTPPAHGAETTLLCLLFLTVASSAIVQFDILYSALAVLSSALFLLLGLRLDRANLPFIGLLMVYNIGGYIALQPYLNEAETATFLVGTSFVAVTGAFFMAAMNENALARFEAIRWGIVAGAVIASLFGFYSYLGFSEAGLLHGVRLMGTFRDSNVFGSFAAAACVLLASDLMITHRLRLIKLGLLVMIALAVFLSFSRGSWGNLAFGLVLLVALTMMTSQDARLRSRVVIATLIGVVVLGLALATMLANDEIAAIFADRFVLQKDYDSGPTGRFGSQLRAIPDLLGRPFGHGPDRFSLFYPENPHNTYLMAFSSYGWLGGIAFLAFSVTTFWITLRAAFTRSPFQRHAICAFAMLAPHQFQNLQIDTDRWRHLFMIYGLCWGLAAITARYRREYLAYAHGAYRAADARGNALVPAE